MQFKDQKVAVLGLARSGVAAAKLLCQQGAQVTVCDQKPFDALSSIEEALKSYPITWCVGPQNQCPPDGTEILVISPGVPIESPPVVRAREMKAQVMGEMEIGFMLCPSRNIAAITGTNGKTTTTALLGEMLSQGGKDTFVAGNIGTPLCEIVEKMTSESVVSLEVSSFQLESIHTFRPRISAILNLSDDHFDRHGNMVGYAAAKARIYENQRGRDVALFNADEPQSLRLAEHCSCRVQLFSRKAGVEDGACVENGQLVIKVRGWATPICDVTDIRIPGDHNLENALAASAMAFEMGVSPESIAKTLKTFAGVEHRLEFVCESQGIRFINDSKGTNPDATMRAISAIKRPTILIAGGYDKHTPFDDVARLTKGFPVKGVVLIGQTAGLIAQALDRVDFANVVFAKTLEEAVSLAAEQCKEGDDVLLSPACASFDMFNDYEHRGREFKRISQQWKEQHDA